ncbi:MAG TPA: uroporphyrinogen-III synthase [Geminicoccaceae bacterium]|nr:uroporphyrinogen-III synthase [Geminicoccus sp.]HMU50094.1 uroporphyrinogen-III synthase [Geminicoccaceae bacterium]
MPCGEATRSARRLRVLVTRPRDQAEATAELLRCRGHDVLVDPVLSIEPVPLAPISVQGYAAAVITSANAVPALPDSMQALPLYVVGAATSAAATAAGWRVSAMASGDGEALARLLVAELRSGRILHIGGEDRAAGLAEGLAGSRLALDHRVAYRAVVVPTLPSATRDALVGDRLDAVLLMSPRTARLWCRLVHEVGLARRAEALIVACLSNAVAEAARSLTWRELRVARSRDQRALVDSLDDPR